MRPNDTLDGAHPDLSAVLVTNMGEARTAVLVWNADAVIVIVIGGSCGTLSELALAKRRGGVPVIALGGWTILDADGNPVPGIDHVTDAETAVQHAMSTEH